MKFSHKINTQAKYGLLYGSVLVLLALSFRWMQWRLLFADVRFDLYTGLLALFCTALGAWIATQVVKNRVRTVVVEKETVAPEREEFVRDEAEFARLQLSNREYEILGLVAKGLSNAEIAVELSLSVSTVKTHLSNLFFKMDVKSRTQAVDQSKKLRIIR